MTTKSFNPYAWKSFYFGKMCREEAMALLVHPAVKVGTFLLRDSSRGGDYSLSVRELENSSDPKCVRHYLIEACKDDSLNPVVRIANKEFNDIPLMLNYYKMHLLDSCSLQQPYRSTHMRRVMALWPFNAESDIELTFSIGDELEVIGEEVDGWLTVRNAVGAEGLVPANYVGVPEYEEEEEAPHRSSVLSGQSIDLDSLEPPQLDKELSPEVPLPAWGRARFDTIANASDGLIALKKSCLVRVEKVYASGIAEGIVFHESEKKPVMSTAITEFLRIHDNEFDPNTPYKENPLITQSMGETRGSFLHSAIEYVSSPDDLGSTSKKSSRIPDWLDPVSNSDFDDEQFFSSSDFVTPDEFFQA